MRQIKGVLLLPLELHHAQWYIASYLGLTMWVVAKYIKSPGTWVCTVPSETELHNRLLSTLARDSSLDATPTFAPDAPEASRKGITLMLLWQKHS